MIHTSTTVWHNRATASPSVSENAPARAGRAVAGVAGRRDSHRGKMMDAARIRMNARATRRDLQRLCTW